ncbi:MAG TPA: hypothetical protein VE172_13745 [Stackebrandtia sp.]|jgi:uncharacterized membrane protein YgcG|uniref:hypothetical protein n=1 Tax=Stackebrandtia sp. TaxID=2023065 RepID=UPI002D66D195|nr:hypothetical protein [Stackebrandtia sp.]HZE39865.1 hypothetical protein [Stackebrandtia sp.]
MVVATFGIILGGFAVAVIVAVVLAVYRRGSGSDGARKTRWTDQAPYIDYTNANNPNGHHHHHGGFGGGHHHHGGFGGGHHGGGGFSGGGHHGG